MKMLFHTSSRTIAALGAIALVGAPVLTSSVQAKGAGPNVVQVAVSSPQFSTLATAVKAAGLASALSTTQNITVFAPTNAAFAKLPKATLAMLLKPENKATLASILKYHVLPMRASAKTAMSLKNGTKVKTLNGESWSLQKTSGGLYLNAGSGGKAKITKTDVLANNGVIHAIDTVILPPSVVRALAAQSKMSASKM